MLAKQTRQVGDIGSEPSNVYSLLWGARSELKSSTFRAHHEESTPTRPGTNKVAGRTGEKHRADKEGNR